MCAKELVAQFIDLWCGQVGADRIEAQGAQGKLAVLPQTGINRHGI